MPRHGSRGKAETNERLRCCSRPAAKLSDGEGCGRVDRTAVAMAPIPAGNEPSDRAAKQTPRVCRRRTARDQIPAMKASAGGNQRAASRRPRRSKQKLPDTGRLGTNQRVVARGRLGCSSVIRNAPPPSRSAPPARAAPCPEHRGASGARLLLVEDQPGVRAFAVQVTEETGPDRVLQAGSGEEALGLPTSAAHFPPGAARPPSVSPAHEADWIRARVGRPSARQRSRYVPK
jgi:hypothetical protein